MAEKRIGFQGVDNGASAMMAKLREQTKQLGTGMIEDARNYSKQSRDQLGFIEDQIKAIEKRNALDKQSAQIQARQKYEGDSKGLSKEMGRINAASSQDDMQLKLLRELIDTVKITAKDEIAENRKSVQQQIQQFKQNPAAFSAEDQLKLSYQQELLTGQKSQKGMFGQAFMGTLLGSVLGNALSRISGVTSSRDEEQDIGSLASSITLVGG